LTVPGVGPVTASAIVATIQDAGEFASGREFAAFLGLTPRQNSTGGKTRLGRITKMGDRYLRKLLVVGACATLRHRKGHNVNRRHEFTPIQAYYFKVLSRRSALRPHAE
jgi:transposase